MSSSPPRHLPLLLVLAAVGAALGLGFGEKWISRHGANVTPVAAGSNPDSPERAAKDPENVRPSLPRGLSDQALLYPEPRVLAPFVLQGSDGTELTNASLKGKWTLAFFGFTNCPDVCPTALATMKQIEELATKNKSAPRIGYLFVSVDPARDTPDVLREYTTYFSPSIVAATAEPAAVEKFATDVGIVFMKAEQPAGDYMIDHSTQILLFDPDGNLHAMWRPPHIPPMMLDDIARMATAAGRA